MNPEITNRKLIFATGEIISDESEIDRIFNDRQKVMEQRESVSPTTFLKYFDLHSARITKEIKTHQYILQAQYGDPQPFQNLIYEIPDLEIDLSPNSGPLPRNIIHFRLASLGKELTIDALYDQTSNKYWGLYRKPEEREKLVEQEMLEALQKKNWHHTFYGWSSSN